MRVIGEIPHPTCKVTLFQWNGKYIVKIEQGHLEQSYKIDETDIIDEGDINKILNDGFMRSVLRRFHEMHTDLVQSLERI
ncbi:hypothetical protein C900_00646 [Fulvivirga imtechensis AK7]|uniref:Uncharacterized protein n=1 Tax=Fulvivirga imtechensis AK7 TaxID=1237149 RepID=L8JHA6_9BACT|nr:hypothetical protein [Fulvivirga imtechensis]ELR68231.1 hypothetical protein C900_00646 [Fulvivirga imtechensis AK7]